MVTQNTYISMVLARIGLMFQPESEEHHAVCEAVTMLKDRNPVKPKVSTAYRLLNGRMSRRRAWCGACGVGIVIGTTKRSRSNFCQNCGTPVQWEVGDSK